MAKGGRSSPDAPSSPRTHHHQLPVVGATEDDYVRKIHDLEGRLVREALEKSQLKQDKDKSALVIADYRSKYQQVSRFFA